MGHSTSSITADRRGTFAAIIVCTALLAGCTASFTYNHLDWLIPSYVDSYVDLTRDQRKNLKGRLEPLLQWHRQEELLRYVEILDRIERDLAAPATALTVRAWFDEIAAALERTERSMLSVALDFSVTLSDAQMVEFTASLREQQREYEKEFLSRSDEEYRRDSYEDLADVLRRFTGPLEASQEERLRAAAGALRRFDRAWLEERALWLDQLEPLLLREPGWQARVQTAYAIRKKQRTPRYREYLSHNLQIISAAGADVLNQLTPGQRSRVAREIEGLRIQLRRLASRPQRAGLQPAATESLITL